MARTDLSRRRALKAMGGSIASGAIASVPARAAGRDRRPGGGRGGGPETTGRHNVGTGSAAALEAATARAAPVYKVLDWQGLGHTVSGHYSRKARDELRERDDVRYVEPDIRLWALGHGTGDESEPWGVERVDADVAAHHAETGDGGHVAIIDTGIDDDHEDVRANLADPATEGNHVAMVSCRGSNCNYDWSDDNDHGTHCAGIVAGVDDDSGVVGVGPDLTLHAVKVLDSSGSGSSADVADGIKWVADRGYDVASMSLGSSSPSSTIRDACSYAYYGYSAALDEHSASEQGVLLVSSAGNDGPCTDCVGYPAAFNQVVAVSSTDEADALSDFSSTGPEVEFAAPGSSIYSTVVGGYDALSGTSMACPHVAGAGGVLMANGYTNEEARQQLRRTAEDVGLAGNEQGRGLLDVASSLCLDSGDDGSGAVPTLSVVTGRQDVVDAGGGDLTATLHGRWACADSVHEGGFRWRRIEPTVGPWNRWTESDLPRDFSHDVDVADHAAAEDCAGYEYYAWARLADGGSEHTGATIAFWNDRSC